MWQGCLRTGEVFIPLGAFVASDLTGSVPKGIHRTLKFTRGSISTLHDVTYCICMTKGKYLSLVCCLLHFVATEEFYMSVIWKIVPMIAIPTNPCTCKLLHALVVKRRIDCYLSFALFLWLPHCSHLLVWLWIAASFVNLLTALP